MANLTIQNEDLRTQLKAVTSQLNEMQCILQNLTMNNNQNQCSNNQRNTNRNNSQRTNNNQRNNNSCYRYPITYCWTHSGVYNGTHNSQTCLYLALNHVREATLDNKIGGSETNLWHAGQISCVDINSYKNYLKSHEQCKAINRLC